MSSDFVHNLPQVILMMIPFLFALSVHEFSHGWVANKLGDPTARLMGRLTLNPFAHADILGTFILPILLVASGAPGFGWAKPVPVNDRNLRNQKTGMFWVALAGPGSNFIMGFMGAMLYVLAEKYLPGNQFYKPITHLSGSFVVINLMLAFFNLIPISPLDGSRIFGIFFSDRVNRRLDELQPFFGIALMMLFLSGIASRYLAIPVFMTADAMVYLCKVLVGA